MRGAVMAAVTAAGLEEVAMEAGAMVAEGRAARLEEVAMAAAETVAGVMEEAATEAVAEWMAV